MQWLAEQLSFNYLGVGELLLRLLLAIALGYLVGIDRHLKHKPVDIRVFMIVAVATCMVGVMGQELYFDYSQADSVVTLDLAKIIEGTLTGIGFLGAGAIIKRGDDMVIGTATGASIWASGGVGLALGFGFYGLSVLTAVTIAIILFVFGMMRDEKDIIED